MLLPWVVVEFGGTTDREWLLGEGEGWEEGREYPRVANAALLAASAPAIAPADAAALIDPPPPPFLLWNFPRPPSGADVFVLCFLSFFPPLGTTRELWGGVPSAPSTPPTMSTTGSPPFMATSELAADKTLTGRLEKMRGEGDADTLGFFDSGSLLELVDRPFLFLPLDLLPCSCSFSACLARTGRT